MYVNHLFQFTQSVLRAHLFNQFDKLINKYNASINKQQRLKYLEIISQMSGYLVQGFYHCKSEESRAIQIALEMVLGQEDAIPPEVTIPDLLQLSVYMHCQNIISSVFRFMEWKNYNGRKVINMGGFYRIDPSDLKEPHEETMYIGYVYHVLNGAYGLHIENEHITPSPKNLRLYLLSQVGTSTPYINDALAAVYNSGDSDVENFGADIGIGDIGSDLYAIGARPDTFSNNEDDFSRNSTIDDVNIWVLNNHIVSVSYLCPIYDKFIKTIVFGLMNDTKDVINGISKGTFAGKTIEFFDNQQFAEKGEDVWRSFQTLLNYYLDECDTDDEVNSNKQKIENKFAFYLLSKYNLLTDSKQS